MTPRPKLTKAERAEIFLENGKRCHLCKRVIADGERWHVEHPTPRWSGGSDDTKELKPAHIDCHAGKSKKEAKLRARNNKARLRHVGLVEPSRSWNKWRPPQRESDPDT